MKEFFPNKVTVCRPANNSEFLERNFSEIKFKVSYLALGEKMFYRMLSNGCTCYGAIIAR